MLCAYADVRELLCIANDIIRFIEKNPGGDPGMYYFEYFCV